MSPLTLKSFKWTRTALVKKYKFSGLWFNQKYSHHEALRTPHRTSRKNVLHSNEQTANPSPETIELYGIQIQQN